jgi:hypothetical protein
VVAGAASGATRKIDAEFTQEGSRPIDEAAGIPLGYLLDFLIYAELLACMRNSLSATRIPHRRTRSASAVWLIVAGVIAALAGAMPILAQQTSSTRDRHVRPARTGQFRQADGVEEFIPRAFEPVHDQQTDLVIVRDTDERGTPYRAAPVAANEATTVSFARHDAGTLILLADDLLPAPRPHAPSRGRAPPLASL